jgi:hypothetical protein
MAKKKTRITLELPKDMLRALGLYALQHTDGNMSAAIRKALREVLK